MTTLREVEPRERCLVNGWLVEVERQARRTTFVRVIDRRMLVDEPVVVQLSRMTLVEPCGPNVVRERRR
jgi:hypothetical protein